MRSGKQQRCRRPEQRWPLASRCSARWISGDLLRRFQSPPAHRVSPVRRVVGPYLGNVITAPMASQLQAVTGIATTLIALIAGLTISLERLGARSRRSRGFTAATLAVVIIGIARLAWFAWPWLPIAPDATGWRSWSIVVAADHHGRQLLADDDGGGHDRDRRPRAPQRARSRGGRAGRSGRCSSSSRSRCSWRARCSRPDARRRQPARPVRVGDWRRGGVRRPRRRPVCALPALRRAGGDARPARACARCSARSGTTQQFEPLLAALAAGLVIENLSVSQGDALKAAIQRGAPPVLVIFFVAIGTSLRLDALPTVGSVALALVLLRPA